jgi:excinuclease UvrABC nuclease subunit
VNTPSVDYSKLIGTSYSVRYRARRVLWLPPQKPVVEAFNRIESEVHRFANEEQAN